jgi:hypothetical protein
MTQEELQAQEALTLKMQEATKGFVKQDAIDTAKAEIQASQETAIKSLEDVLVEQGNLINELKEAKVKAEAPKTIIGEITELVKTAKQNDYNDFKAKKAPMKVQLKSAGDMTIATNVTGETTLLPTATMLTGYNPYRWNPATFWDYANVRRTAAQTISWVEEVNPDGTPAVVSEAGAKPAIDFDLLVEKSSAIKIADNLKVSDEMLDDISFIGSEIQSNLVDRVRLATSSNIYTYITTLSGILTAVDSTLDGMGGSAPTMWQLISAAKTTILKNNHRCTHIFLNPTDYGRLLLTKGVDNYAVHLNLSAIVVDGVNIVSSNAVPVDKFLACDLTKLNVYTYMPLEVEMGWVNADFTNNMRTFVGEHRIHRFIRGNDKTAFLYGDVTDSLTALTL